MKRKLLTALLVLAILFILACNFAQPSPTSVAVQPTVAIETPTNAISEIPTSTSGNNFTIPQGLATGAAPASIPASLDPNALPWDIHPAYTEFALDGYILQNTFHQPKIFI